jgi:hypothetical protein
MNALTGIDLLGIQKYVFTSNRLRDVVSASWLVQWVTSCDGALLSWRDQVLHAGGGSAVLAFDSMDEAKTFAGVYTRKILENAPGLELVVTHHPIQNGLAESLRDLQVILARKKLERKPHVEALGLAVTAACGVTGLPATAIDRLDGTPVSKQIETWRCDDTRKKAASRWEKYLEFTSGWRFPTEIDELGRTRGDTSLLAVVHVDANAIGEKIRTWLSRCVEKRLDETTVRDQYREWSRWIEVEFQRVWRCLVERVLAAIHDRHLQGSIPRLNFELRPGKLPVRPVLLGGDDLTFLCDGRIGLDLAATALREIGGRDCPHLGTMSACAGVAIVRAHYPFVRAYELAEKLCSQAKSVRRQHQDEGCWLDWHIGVARPTEPVQEFRDRLYRADGLQLTCRPYRLGSAASDGGTWSWLSGTLLGTSGTGLRGPGWGRRRNKVKALASLARQGPNAVRSALHAWQVMDRQLVLPTGLDDSGFNGDRTPLLDAIELVDVHLPLGVNHDNPGSHHG